MSQTAVYGWRRRWHSGGEQALVSKGPSGSRCRLDTARLDRLERALDEGSAAHGFGADQRWTLARVSDLIARTFNTRYILRGTANIMYRLGWSVQVPKHRAVERDDARDHRVAAGDVAGGKTVAAQRQAWLVCEDEAGQTLRPPKVRTWGRRGVTPVVPVSGLMNSGVWWAMRRGWTLV